MRALVLFALLPAAALAACHGERVDAGGPAVTRSFALTGFDAVQLTGSDDVEVRTGDGFAIQASGPKDVIEHLKVELDGTTLKIGRDGNMSWNWGGTSGAKIVVTMPAIKAAKLTGSGDFKVDRAAGDFDGVVSGSGDMAIGALAGGKAALSVTGSGTLAAAGSASTLNAVVAGSGDIDAGQLKVSQADVSITGSGSINADVAGPANVSITGSGDATLGKGAQCTIHKTGSGEANCG